MKKSQLELALSAAGKIARDSEFIVFGSQSILGTVPKPPKACLVSEEVDLYPRNHPQAMLLVANRLGQRSPFSRRHGFFVDCVTPDLAAFPEGWTDRLIPFRTKRTRGITGWCVELHDVSASKLAAGREKDLAYVRTLLVARLIKPDVIENRIVSLPVNPSHREEILALVKRLVREARAVQKAKPKNK
jgi:hypothetical protein